MHKQNNILTLSLIITGLAINPAMGNTVERRAGYTQINHLSLASRIATILYNRGLDEDAASAVASEFANEEDEKMLSLLLQNLERHNIATQEEVLTYLSQQALHKHPFDPKSYDQLIGMVEKIRKKPLNSETRTKLSAIAKQTQLFG